MDKVKKFKSIANDLVDLYESKNNDYGDAFGKTYESLGIISSLTRISDKYNRLITLATHPNKQKVNDESIEDTLKDMASYCIMTLIEIDNRRGE